MFLFYLAMIPFSINTQYAIKYQVLIFFSVFISLTIIYSIKTPKDLNQIVRVCGIVYVIEICIALGEGLRLWRYPISPFSPIIGMFGRHGSDLSQFSAIDRKYLSSSPTGFHWNPNDLSIVALLGLPFLLLNKKRIVRIVGTIFVTILIIFAGSRGVFFAFCVTITIYLLFMSPKRMFFRLLIPFVCIALFVFLPELRRTTIADGKIAEAVSSIDAVFDYFSGTGISEGGSISVRRKLIAAGINELESRYFFGAGGGGSTAVLENIGGIHNITSMHNFWIELLVDGGLCFFVAFVLWYFAIILRLFCNSRRDCGLMRYYSSACCLSLVGFSIACISASSVIYLLSFWILLGLSVSVINLSSNKGERIFI
jgi:teichuronic acid biosynthesis protein TuaE